MTSPKVQCVITIDGDVWYEEKTYRGKKLKIIEESKSIKRGKRILRLDKIPMERIKPVCDRQKCYENCVKKRLVKNNKNAKNSKQKNTHLKIKSKKHENKNKKCDTRKNNYVNGKPKTGSNNHKKCDKKTKHKKKRPASKKIKHDHQNILCTTTSTITTYIEGLSPISCEENLELSYESISSASFSEDDVEVKSKAKERIKKRSKHIKHDEPSPIQNHTKIKLPDPETATHDLATNNGYSSPTFELAATEPEEAEPLRSSTPSNAEDNATVFSSEMDVSIHSMETVVMSPRVDSSIYSPTTSPSELILFYKGYDNDDDQSCYKTAVKIEPYDCERNDSFSLTSNLDTEVKTEIKLETIKDMDVGHKFVKNEPNNNDSTVYFFTNFLGEKDCSDNAMAVVKKEQYPEE